MNPFFKVTGDRFELNVPLMKYDERTGEFEGWATLEQLDLANEICDIEKSWPYFKAWSDKLSKATDGENLGNVREMHENIAAGKLTAMDKTIHPLGVPGIYVKGIAVDAGSKDKLTKRVLVGLSIGGRYIEKMDDPNIKGATRFVANPVEISLVDNPCVPDAMITVVKADGSEELRKAVGFTPSQFWSCRAGLKHAHVTKADAKACDGTAEAGKIQKGGVSELLLEKSLYTAATVAEIIMRIQNAATDLEFEAQYEQDQNDADAAAALNDSITGLYDVLLSIVENERAEFTGLPKRTLGTDEDNGLETPDGSEILGDPVFMMTALSDFLKKAPISVLKSLRVQLGNGSNNTDKESTMKIEEVQKAAEDKFRAMLQPLATKLGLKEGDDVFGEIVKRLPAGTTVVAVAEKTDEPALAKSLSDLTKAVTSMHNDVKKDRARIDGIEKSVDLLGITLAKTLAFVTGVKVEDDTDLEQVIKAIQGKPAAPKPVLRAVTKVDDSAAAETTVTTTEKKTGHPLVDGARLIAAF